MRLRDLLDSESGVRLVYGKHQLGRTISWAYTTDLRDPSRYLFGGELVLTSGLWHQGLADCEAFVAALDGAKAAALAVGTGHIGTLPDDLVATCQMYRMPLFEIPADVSFRTVSEAIVNRTSASRARYLTDVLLQLRSLLAISGAGRDEAILDRISAEVRASCWLLSATGRVLVGTCPLSPAEGAVAAAAAAAARSCGRSSVRATTPAGRDLVVIAPRGDHRSWDRLLVCELNTADWPIERRELIADAAQLLCPEEAPTAESRQVTQKLARRLLEVLARDDSDPSDIAALLRLTDLHRAPAVGIVVASSADPALAAVMLSDLPSHAEIAPLVAAGEDESVAFAATGADGRTLLGEVQALTDRIRPVFGTRPLWVGVSEPAGTAAGLRRSLLQARSALTRARAQDGLGVAGVDDLTSAATLIVNVAPDVRSAYRDRVLGPVLSYDRAHDTELEATLRAYLDADGSLQACAEALHVHTNTVRYRLRRVGELTGRKLSSLPDRVDLYMATKASDGLEITATRSQHQGNTSQR